MNSRLFCHPLSLLFIELGIINTSILGNILSYGAPVQYRDVALNSRNYGLLNHNNSIHTAIENRLFSTTYKPLQPPEVQYDVKSDEEKMCFSYHMVDDPSFLEEMVEKISHDRNFVKKILTKLIPIIIDLTSVESEIKDNNVSRTKRAMTTYPGYIRKSGKGFNHYSRQADAEKKKINLFGLELEAASGGVWKKALESTLGEQKMYTTAASSLVKGVLRWVAWTIFAVGVYGSDNLLSF